MNRPNISVWLLVFVAATGSLGYLDVPVATPTSHIFTLTMRYAFWPSALLLVLVAVEWIQSWRWIPLMLALTFYLFYYGGLFTPPEFAFLKPHTFTIASVALIAAVGVFVVWVFTSGVLTNWATNNNGK